MATNRFLCEICNKGFQRDQNLQLHRRGHNLPWKLKQRSNKEVRKKVYICPEKSCVHHEASRALGDLTGIKKHYSRKHGEKKWKCDKCSKKYAVQSDWKAHAKICGTREYKCDCGTLFSRKDSFITHRAFCDALAEESARFSSPVASANLSFRNELLNSLQSSGNPQFPAGMFRGVEGGNQVSMDKPSRLPLWLDSASSNNNNFMASTSTTLPELHHWLNRAQGQDHNQLGFAGPGRALKEEEQNKGNNMSQAISSLYYSHETSSNAAAQMSMSATALLQKAAQMGSTDPSFSTPGFGLVNSSFNSASNAANLHGMMSQIDAESSLTRDFLGVGGNGHNRQFLQENELASIGSAFDMTHYNTNH